MKKLITISLILFLVSSGLKSICQSSLPLTNNDSESANTTMVVRTTPNADSITGDSALFIHRVGSHPTMSTQSGIRRTELQRYDLSVSGREVVQVRIDFDAGTEFGNHSHPGEEIIYVLEGLLEYQVEGQPVVTLKAGEVLFIPYGTIHSAKNVGTVTASELATYIVEKGKPILVPK